MNRDLKFPKVVQLAAQAEERATGIPACVSLAQWALESDYGRVMSGKNNPFGIKAAKGTVRRTWEVITGRVVITSATFRDFASLADAFTFHGKMLTNPLGYYTRLRPILARYKASKDAGYRKAVALEVVRSLALPNKPAYATDPAYASKLISIIESWRLYELNLPAK